jgi:hypothetical protein
MNISHTVNQFLENGEAWDRSILLHIEDNIILRLDNFADLESLIDQLNWIRNEIFTSNPELSH